MPRARRLVLDELEYVLALTADFLASFRTNNDRLGRVKIMSEIWKTMSGDEREAYRSRARDDQKRYKAEQADKVMGRWIVRDERCNH